MKCAPSTFVKRCLLLCTVIMISLSSKSQNYYHGIGGQMNYGIYNILYSNGAGTYTSQAGTIIPGGVYKATYSFTDNDFLNIAVSGYPFLGLNISASSQFGASYQIGVELPLDLEIYLGNMEEGCFFIGGGWSFAFLSSNYFGGGPIIGPQANIGVQFPLRGRVTGIRLSMTTGINASKTDDPAITILSDKKSMITIGGYYLF